MIQQKQEKVSDRLMHLLLGVISNDHQIDIDIDNLGSNNHDTVNFIKVVHIK